MSVLTLTSRVGSGGLTVLMGLIDGFMKKGKSVGLVRPTNEGIQVEGNLVDKATVIVKEKFKVGCGYDKVNPGVAADEILLRTGEMRADFDLTIVSLQGSAGAYEHREVITGLCEGPGVTRNLLILPHDAEWSSEIKLNNCYYGGKVDGVILNKVDQGGVVEPSPVEIVGAIPKVGLLEQMSSLDLVEVFGGRRGAEGSVSHFDGYFCVGSASEGFEAAQNFRDMKNPLVMVPYTRPDILTSLVRCVERSQAVPTFVLTSSPTTPSPYPPSLSAKLAPYPVYTTTESAFHTIRKIASIQAFPHRFDDDEKIKAAVDVVSMHVNLDRLNELLF
eukprot:TRINITY_DN25486_c0_g1_i1.p1 TRINITY_DN25486_c0_g1~~TRINITY_DN25486_c0_g1_i1.p1  ORF type:complete len:348 (+),score=18.36 TRINITY_DN25486_c0_g1_i1:51-1046(+)